MKKLPPAISAPKMKLPGHNESYNPPDEYLMSEVRILAKFKDFMYFCSDLNSILPAEREKRVDERSSRR